MTADPSPLGQRHAAMHYEIRHRICLLTYPPGMRLSETALAEEFGTSRTPLRRVLARLEDEGLVQSQHGVGTFVTDANARELAQVYGLRVALTALVGKLDPVVPDAAFMAELDNMISRGESIIRSGSAADFTRFDMDVFQLLLGLTANAPLRDTLERLYFQTKRIWHQAAIAARLDLDQEYRIFQHELEAVRLALLAGDLTAAAQLQSAHISMSFQRLQTQSS